MSLSFSSYLISTPSISSSPLQQKLTMSTELLLKNSAIFAWIGNTAIFGTSLVLVLSTVSNWEAVHFTCTYSLNFYWHPCVDCRDRPCTRWRSYLPVHIVCLLSRQVRLEFHTPDCECLGERAGQMDRQDRSLLRLLQRIWAISNFIIHFMWLSEYVWPIYPD